MAESQPELVDGIQDESFTLQIPAPVCSSSPKYNNNVANGSSPGQRHLGSSASTSGDSGVTELMAQLSNWTLTPGDSECKYKISIYSKASGCRMTNLPDPVILKQLRVAILDHVVQGNVEMVKMVPFAFEKMKNGGLQVVSPREDFINKLADFKFFAGIPCKMTHPDTPRYVNWIDAKCSP